MEERRGRPKEIQPQEQSNKFTRNYEDEFTTEIWIYNLEKFSNGPMSVEIKYKPGAEKAMKQHVKEGKKQKKIAREMKKINNRNKIIKK
jgi:hypothetical protein